MAGWHNGLFYLRDYHDNYRLHVNGRASIDGYTYFGRGVADAGLRPTLLLRRIRPEVSGEFFQDWSFWIAGELGATALDNPNGTTETSAAAPGVTPTATTGRYAGAQTARLTARPDDVYITYRASRLLNAQLGQFDAPFTLENRTGQKYLPWMERALAVRVVGIPTDQEIGLMLRGETDEGHWYYSVAAFNGDGPNRPNADSHLDYMARTFVHPFASRPDLVKDLQFGASARYGTRGRSVNYDYPSMTTQGNYAFWLPTYVDSGGSTIHILPNGRQLGVAAEVRIPWSIFTLTSELVEIKNGTREAIEGQQATSALRSGELEGHAYYVQLEAWPVGARDITGRPGYENAAHVDFSKPDPVTPPHALHLLLKWEQMALRYASASRRGSPDPANADGSIKVNVVSVGANYWRTKFLRLSINYVLNDFPDSAPRSPTTADGVQQTARQRAVAPGNTLSLGVNDGARDRAHVLHELLFRASIGF